MHLSLYVGVSHSVLVMTHSILVSSFSVTVLQMTRYRCRKCRRLLFTCHNIIPADTAVGRRLFKGSWRQPQAHSSENPEATLSQVNGSSATAAGAGAGAGSDGQDSSMFLVPMQWMQEDVVGAVQGKLYCPNCKARLGSFNWAGEASEAW